MKKYFSFILILTFTQLKAQGISFETEWTVAVEKATKENKMIFMDIYTTWCRPCKVWDKKIFQDSTVGEFFNKNFINLKCNAETSWGIKANKHYGFGVFPTFLFIDPVSFEPFYRNDSYNQDTKAFIDEGGKAIQCRNSTPLSMMVKEYEKGRRDMDFLRKLIQRKSSISLDFTNELIEFMRIFSLDELTKDNYISWRKVKIAFGSPEYYKIKSKINQNTLASGNNRIIVLMSANAIMDTAINRKNEKLFNQMLNELSSIGETNQKVDYLRIEFYHKMGQFEKAFPLVDKYIAQYVLIEKIEGIKKRDSSNFVETMKPFVLGIRDSVKEKDEFEFSKDYKRTADARTLAFKLNKLVELFVLNTKNPDDLKKLLHWSTISLDLEPNYEMIAKNYALLLYKNNKIQESIEKMKHALVLMNKTATENDSDNMTQEVSNIKELLTKMQNRTL